MCIRDRLWSVLNPLLMCLVYWAVFSSLMDMRGSGIDNFAVFLMCGQLLFMNLWVPYINDLTRQTPYGYVKPAKKAKEGCLLYTSPRPSILAKSKKEAISNGYEAYCFGFPARPQ